MRKDISSSKKINSKTSPGITSLTASDTKFPTTIPSRRPSLSLLVVQICGVDPSSYAEGHDTGCPYIVGGGHGDIVVSGKLPPPLQSAVNSSPNFYDNFNAPVVFPATSLRWLLKVLASFRSPWPASRLKTSTCTFPKSLSSLTLCLQNNWKQIDSWFQATSFQVNLIEWFQAAFSSSLHVTGVLWLPVPWWMSTASTTETMA